MKIKLLLSIILCSASFPSWSETAINPMVLMIIKHHLSGNRLLLPPVIIGPKYYNEGVSANNPTSAVHTASPIKARKAYVVGMARKKTTK